MKTRSLFVLFITLIFCYNCMFSMLLCSHASEVKEFTHSYKEYFVFGEERAGYDQKQHIKYAYNNFGMPLLANVQSKQEENLLKKYMYSEDSIFRRSALKAFVNGYRRKTIQLYGRPIITNAPLIQTLVASVILYVSNHNGRLPMYCNTEDLYNAIKRNDIGIDAYAGSQIRYGVNLSFSGKSLGSKDDQTVLIWELVPKSTKLRWIAYGNGIIKKVSSVEWASISRNQQLIQPFL